MSIAGLCARKAEATASRAWRCAAVEAMEGVTHCHQLKAARQIEVFGPAGPPLDVRGSSLGGKGLGVGDRLLLLVDCEDIGEILGEGEGRPAWPTRKVQQPAGPLRAARVTRSYRRGRIGDPIAVVVAGRALIKVGPELGPRLHVYIIVPSTASWQHPGEAQWP